MQQFNLQQVIFGLLKLIFDYVSKSFYSPCVVSYDMSGITGRRLLRHKYICYFRFEKKVMEGLFFGYKLIIMGEELLIRDAVLFL